MSCKCKRCQEACKHTPGLFSPDQINKVAEHFGLPISEIFKKYLMSVISYDFGKKVKKVLSISPAAVGRQGTEIFHVNGSCVFYKSGRCSIHEIKPLECVQAFGCESQSLNVRLAVLNKWKTEENQQFVLNVINNG